MHVTVKALVSVLIISFIVTITGTMYGNNTPKTEEAVQNGEEFMYLSNTYYKLTTDKKLNVAFLGG